MRSGAVACQGPGHMRRDGTASLPFAWRAVTSTPTTPTPAMSELLEFILAHEDAFKRFFSAYQPSFQSLPLTSP